MSSSLVTTPATDSYQTFACPSSARVRITVSNAPILWKRGQGFPGAVYEAEESLLPGLYSFDEDCDVIQFKSQLPVASLPVPPGAPKVSIATRNAAELGQGGGGGDG
jgi:hypothetical protein